MSRIAQIFTDPLSILYTLPAVLIGLTVHEWAHAFAAYKLGDTTARDMGRMTLNPFAHIDWIGFLSLLLLGFGWAKPVPVNPRNFKNFRRDDIVVSLAGITMNLIVAFFASIIFAVLLYCGIYNAALYTIVQSIIVLNIALMVFNLIPVYPLDGSHVFESLFMRKIPKACFFLRQYGMYILILVIIVNSQVSFLSTIVSWIFTGLLSAASWLVGLFF